MNRNSNIIFIESPSGDPDYPCITPIPWVNNAPDFTGITEPTLSVLMAAYERDKNNIVDIPDPVPTPIVVIPDWDGLNAAILGGALNPIYTRLFASAFGDVAINAAFTVLIPSIQTTRIESAVASAFAALNAYTSYRFTNAEKTLWNGATDSLNFSSLVHLP
jgi:hypothetical protein